MFGAEQPRVFHADLPLISLSCCQQASDAAESIMFKRSLMEEAGSKQNIMIKKGKAAEPW